MRLIFRPVLVVTLRNCDFGLLISHLSSIGTCVRDRMKLIQLDRVITGDVNWYFQYDPEINWQSQQWLPLLQPD